MKKTFNFLIMILAVAIPASAVDLQGHLVQGGLAQGRVEVGTELKLNGTPVKVGKQGHFVIGFGRDDVSATLSTKEMNADWTSQTITIGKRTFNIEKVNGLPPKTVSPPPEWAARRKVEGGRVKKARSYNGDTLFWWDGFVKPAEGRFSGFYGSQRILNGKPRSPHYGLDIANKVGTKIIAPASGIVRLAAPDFLLEGGIVIIDHGYSVTSTMFHMNSVDVKEGDFVKKGAAVGAIGAKGRASGPHVDWRINWGKVRLDPGLFVGLK